MTNHMLSAYLNRIQFAGEIDTERNTLFRLHKHQHQAIPFENLDVINGLSIKLDQESLFNKLVFNNRGGYCYELNGLLHNVLKKCHFNVVYALGRVHVAGQPSGRGHLVNIVTFKEQAWLVDAGFGAHTPRAPLSLQCDREQVVDQQVFRFVKDELFGFMLQHKGIMPGEGKKQDWLDLYSLDMTHVCLGDIEYGNHFASTGPDSLFCSNVIAAARTEKGSHVLFNDRLKLSQGDTITEHILEDEASYNRALKEYFGIDNPVSFDKIRRHFIGQ